MASNEIVSENSLSNIQSYVLEEKEEASSETCYARHCETYQGAGGYEYKRCGPWEEVPYPSVKLAE